MENENRVTMDTTIDELVHAVEYESADTVDTPDEELAHYGVPGMKWGVRRTPAQLGHKPVSKKLRKKAKKLVNKIVASHQAKKAAKAERKKQEEERKKELEERNKPISKMTDSELREHLNRVRMEREAYMIDKDIAALNPKKVSVGQKFVNDFKEKALGPAAMEAGKKLMSNLMNKAVEKALGDGAADPLKELKREAEKAGYKQTIANAKNAAEKAKWQEYVTRQKADEYNASRKKAETTVNTAVNGNLGKTPVSRVDPRYTNTVAQVINRSAPNNINWRDMDWDDD